MPGSRYDPTASAPMAEIVRVAVIAVTIALFAGSAFNALMGQREIAIVLALATPLGISAWGFARAGHNEAAIVLLCCLLVSAVTLILVMSPLGVHDGAIVGYSGVVLMGALLLTRRSFYLVLGATLAAAGVAFGLEIAGVTHSFIARLTSWLQLGPFLALMAVFAIIGRVSAEALFASLGGAQSASLEDAVTGLHSRGGFVAIATQRLRATLAGQGTAVLVVADLDAFARLNQVIGHLAADRVLAEAARRLRQACGEHLAARIGDDEFAVLAVGMPEAEAEAFAGTLRRALDFDYSGVSVRNAVGYSRFPRDAHGFEALLMGAESALASAKAREGERLAGPGDRI